MRTSSIRRWMAITILGTVFGTGCALLKPQEQPYTGPAYPKTDLVVGYEVDPDWPAKPAGIEWGHAPGIAVDKDNRIWVITRSEPPVQVYAADGTFIKAWGQGLFETVHQIRIDSKGHIWIADAAQHTVQKFTPEGKLLLTLGIPGEAGHDETHLDMPTDMAISPSGDVFVTDGYGNNRIVRFDPQGKFVKSWGKMGTGPGEFSLPHSIALDSKGQVYVAGRNNNRIQVFDPDGKLLRTFPQILVPWSILMTPEDEVYVCGSSPMRWGERPSLGLPPKDQLVMKFDTQGRLLELWTFPVGETGKEKPGELNWVHGIAIDADGDLYLGDIMGKRVQKFVRLPAKR